jgi:hypothetical protein
MAFGPTAAHVDCLQVALAFATRYQVPEQRHYQPAIAPLGTTAHGAIFCWISCVSSSTCGVEVR